MYRIVLEREAAKRLERLPAKTGDLIIAKIEQLAENPDSLRNNVTKLVGSKQSRLRIGDWRVLFFVDGEILVVSRIAPRGGAYD